MSWQMGSFALLTVALAAGFAWYERTRPDARIVALVGTLAAFAALGRIAFAALPNVKPTTDIVLISGYALGGAPGFVVGALAGLTSNFFFGQGPWTPWQMAAWGMTGVIGALLAHASSHRIGRLMLAIVCGVVGFAFTAFQDLGSWVTYSDQSLAQLGVYVGKGVGFDLVHAAGCVLFALALGPALTRSIARFAARLEVQWGPATRAAARRGVVRGGLTLALVGLSSAWLAGQPGSGATFRVLRFGLGSATAANTPAGYLLSAQNSDGGFGPSAGAASTQLFSGWAALGLAAAGDAPQSVSHGGSSLLSYVQSGSPSDIGSVERTILVLRAAGVSPGGLLGTLQGAIRADGSVQDQVNLTSFAVLALRASGAAPAGRTIAWLARQQDSDGGFNFASAGGSSDVDDTGAALEALSGTGEPHIDRAVRFIESQQNGDGGFPAQAGGASNAQSTAFAIQGLIAAGAGGSAVSRGIQYLQSLIAPDGHVRYSSGSDQTPVWVTGEALMALERKPLPLAPVAVSGGGSARALARLGPVRAHHARHARSTISHPRSHRARARPMIELDQLAADAGIADALALAPIG